MQGAQPPPELLAYKALQAVQRGNAEELAQLIQAGANAHVINAVVKTGTSPNGRPDREAKGGLLYHAVEKESVELVKVLLGNGAEVNGSKQDESPPPLRAAVMRKNIELVTLLLKRGANVNRKYTITANSSKISTTVLFEETSDAVYSLLLRRGGDVNVRDSWGDTPLHVHAEKWHANFVNELIEHGADVNALDEGARTPLVRAIEHWDFPPDCDTDDEFIDVCHLLMSHKATPPPPDSISCRPKNYELLLKRLQLVKELTTQRNVGMVVLSLLPVEIYRKGVAEIAAYFAANTLVPVAVEQSEIRTETLPEAPRRQVKAELAASTPGEEVLQRKVELLPALDRSLSVKVKAPSSDEITPFPIRQDLKPAMTELSLYKPKRSSNAAWIEQEDLVDQLLVRSKESTVNNVETPVKNVEPEEQTEKPAHKVEPIPSISLSEADLCLKNAVVAHVDPPSRPITAESVVSEAKRALPPVSSRSGLPVVAPLQLYHLKILCATGLRRALKYRRQNPYCICRLVRGDGEVLVQVQTSVHPGGGQVPTWRGQVFELALTPENTRTCTLVFVLKHSGVVASLDERIAVGMMPFPHIPIGHSLAHKLLLMNNDQLAGRLEIYLEAY